jgi:hypothetical protein
MESALRSVTKTPSSFPPPPPAHQPPLLPLPAQAPLPQHSFWPAPRTKKMVAPAIDEEVEWTEADSLYSVSPPPSCVPMPTFLLATVAVPTACAVEVAGAGATVDVGATDELRRLLRL